jgi:hypothetical protein
MATKTPIVSKKQLEESGFDNLRDYLNNKRGLTRRDGKVALRKGDMDIKSAAEKRSATRMDDVKAKKPRAERRSDTRLRASQSSSATAKSANMLTKPPSAKGAEIQSMDTDMMRTASRTAAKEAGQRRKASAEDAAKAKDKATYKKGGFVPFAAAAKKPGVKKPGITKPAVKKPAVKKPMPSFMMKRGSKK